MEGKADRRKGRVWTRGRTKPGAAVISASIGGGPSSQISWKIAAMPSGTLSIKEDTELKIGRMGKDIKGVSSRESH